MNRRTFLGIAALSLADVLFRSERPRRYSYDWVIDQLDRVDTSAVLPFRVDLCVDPVLAEERVGRIMGSVRAFYAEMNVEIDVEVVPELRRDLYGPAERIGLQLLGKEQFEEAYPDHKVELYRLNEPGASVQEIEKKRLEASTDALIYGGEGFVELNVVLVECATAGQLEEEIYLTRHELGHMLGLLHPHAYPVFNENIAALDELKYSFMSQREMGTEWEERQVQFIHSYLQKGAMYDLWRDVAFNLGRFEELTRLANTIE